ncbi:MAG: ATP-binding protein [Deltaproteobacteria bacterium]|nr:ATP-binding protein [Deltaproteobacteria bacterium]
MDDTTLDSLRMALAASPDNQPLLRVLLEAYLERHRAADGYALLSERSPTSLTDPTARFAAARVCLEAGHPERAIELASVDDPPVLVLRARALLALARREEARAAYEKAVAQSPAVEDLDLKAAVAATTRTVTAGPGGAKLRVIANDDTDSSEVERLLSSPQKPITFVDVGGLDEIKEQIRKRIVLPFQKPSLFERFKKRVGGGILLYGPPGCGKTLLARATAGECKAAFFSVAISDILDMYIGESERKLSAIFEKARSSPPAVLFFDELEALAGKRQYSREATSSKLVSSFLSEMDGFAQRNQGVLILGATNVPWAIDPAFRRPGRFDRVLFVPPPDGPARERVLQIQLEGRPHAADLDLKLLSSRTSTFSGADLTSLIEDASDRAIERSLAEGRDSPIRQADLVEAIRAVKPTALEWLTTARNYARYANESGQYDEVLEFLRTHGKE